MGLGAPEIILILIAFSCMWLIPAVWGYNAGSKRTIGSAGGLLLGLFLSMLGVIIVYCTRRIDEKPFYNLPGLSATDEIQKYKQLLDSGAITESEYNLQKARILNSTL